LSDFESSIESVVSLPGASGKQELVTIRGTTTALLSTLADGSRSLIRWAEGNVVFLIEGPRLQHDEAIDIANQV